MADDLLPNDGEAQAPSEARRREREEASPGALLRAARLAKKLETKEVAATLNVDPWMLDALEHDEYGALGAPVFAKGHLRKYAAALGIDDGDVLVAYYQREGAREAPPLIAESILRVQAARKRGFGWLAPALGVLALSVIALALFLFLQPDDGADSARAAVVQAEEPAASTGDGGERSQQLRLPSASVSADDADTSTQRTSDPAARMAAASADTDEPTSAATIAATATPPTSVSSPPVTRLETRPAATSSRPAARVATPAAVPVSTLATGAPAPAGQVRVTLDFSGDSWVEIYDANRRKLIYDMGRAGSRRTVTGVGPLQVFLGKASDVNVRVNGEPHAVERITRLGTARFYVDRPAR